MTQLKDKQCPALSKDARAIDADTAAALAAEVPHWKLNANADRISATFNFKNYYQTVAFVNAAAWIAHRQNHHPDIQFGYRACTVDYSTHSVGGLSESDFICAAKISALYEEGPGSGSDSGS